MKKLTLHLDELAVETFDPAVNADGRPGTVKGNGETLQQCCTFSCGGTCGANPDSNWLRMAKTITNCPDCCV